MEKLLFNVDSRMRDKKKYPKSEFFRFEQDINFKNIDYISLASIEIPNSFFIFSQERGSNSFKIKDGAGIWNTIKIESNNYSLNDLIIELNNSLDLIYGPGFFIFSVNTQNFISLTRTIPGPFEIDFKNGLNYYPSLGYYLGYRNDSYISNGILKADVLPDVNGENYIFVRINNWGNMQVQPTIPINVLAKIIMKGNKGTIIYDNKSDFINKTYIFRQPQNVNKMEIELIDAYGNQLINNGLDWSMTLEVGQIYKKDKYLMKLNSNI